MYQRKTNDVLAKRLTEIIYGEFQKNCVQKIELSINRDSMQPRNKRPLNVASRLIDTLHDKMNASSARLLVYTLVLLITDNVDVPEREAVVLSVHIN